MRMYQAGTDGDKILLMLRSDDGRKLAETWLAVAPGDRLFKMSYDEIRAGLKENGGWVPTKKGESDAKKKD